MWVVLEGVLRGCLWREKLDSGGGVAGGRWGLYSTVHQ